MFGVAATWGLFVCWVEGGFEDEEEEDQFDTVVAVTIPLGLTPAAGYVKVEVNQEDFKVYSEPGCLKGDARTRAAKFFTAG